MGWGAEQTILAVNQTVAATAVDGPWVTLLSHEVCHYQVNRVDSPRTERWGIRVMTSPNASRADTVPFSSIVLESTDTVKSLIITGIYSFRIQIYNADLTPVDKVWTDHYYRLNETNI